jgi:L-rhamnose mutarotase
MVRIGQVWRTKPGKAEAYRRFHARIPEVVERLFRDLGVTNYTVFAWGDICFACLEVENYEELVERYNRHPEAQAFEKQAAEFIEFESDPVTGWPLQLDEIWSLPKASAQNVEDRG